LQVTKELQVNAEVDESGDKNEDLLLDEKSQARKENNLEEVSIHESDFLSAQESYSVLSVKNSKSKNNLRQNESRNFKNPNKKQSCY